MHNKCEHARSGHGAARFAQFMSLISYLFRRIDAMPAPSPSPIFPQVWAEAVEIPASLAVISRSFISRICNSAYSFLQPQATNMGRAGRLSSIPASILTDDQRSRQNIPSSFGTQGPSDKSESESISKFCEQQWWLHQSMCFRDVVSMQIPS